MYQVDPQGKIIRIDGYEIPKDITNPAYTQYLHWVQHGNYIGPEIAKEIVVEEAPVFEMPETFAADIGKTIG